MGEGVVCSMNQNNSDFMSHAYKYLYEIENRLRLMIKTNMKEYYGHNWIIRLNEKRSEQNSNIYELVAFFGKYQNVLTHFSEPQRNQLQLLTSVRNKIAHSHCINQKDFELLKECHCIVMKQPITKRKNNRIIVR